MGVNNLWKILKEHCETVPLTWSSMHGKVFAVDLSFWIVEASTAMKNVHDPQFRPYLRNTFFRIKHLLSLGVLLVFVIDGAPPPQKFETLKKRGVFGNNNSGKRASLKKFNNSHFRRACKECVQLLKCLGIPCIDLQYGEAEAYCALLNKFGYVDGVLTPDGDAFLFGGEAVFSDYRMKNDVMTFVKLDKLKDLGLTQRNFIALALILGSDYTCQSGVKGIGEKRVITLLKQASELYGQSNDDWLRNIECWVKSSEAQFDNMINRGNGNAAQFNVSASGARKNKSKANKKSVVEKFVHNIRGTYRNDVTYFEEVVEAYLDPFWSDKDAKKLQCKPHKVRPKWIVWNPPDLVQLREFGETYMQMECKLMDRHCLDISLDLHLNFGSGRHGLFRLSESKFDFEIENIIKRRVKNRVAMFGVQWKCLNDDFVSQIFNTSDNLKCEGIHFADTINSLRPDLVKSFEISETQKKTLKKASKRKKKTDESKLQTSSKSKKQDCNPHKRNKNSQTKRKTKSKSSRSQTNSLKNYYSSENEMRESNKTANVGKKANAFKSAFKGDIYDISDSSDDDSVSSDKRKLSFATPSHVHNERNGSKNKKNQKSGLGSILDHFGDISDNFHDPDTMFCDTNLNEFGSNIKSQTNPSDFSNFSKFDKFSSHKKRPAPKKSHNNNNSNNSNNSSQMMQNSEDEMLEMNQLVSEMSVKKGTQRKSAMKSARGRRSNNLGRRPLGRIDTNRMDCNDDSDSPGFLETSSSDDSDCENNNKNVSKRHFSSKSKNKSKNIQNSQNSQKSENWTGSSYNKKHSSQKSKSSFSANKVSDSESNDECDMELSLQDRLRRRRRKSSNSEKTKIKANSSSSSSRYETNEDENDSNVCELSNLMGNLSIVKNDLSRISEEAGNKSLMFGNDDEFNVTQALNWSNRNGSNIFGSRKKSRPSVSPGQKFREMRKKLGTWICDVCTFENECNDLKCLMCQTSKPVAQEHVQIQERAAVGRSVGGIRAGMMRNEKNYEKKDKFNTASSTLTWKCHRCMQMVAIEINYCPYCE